MVLLVFAGAFFGPGLDRGSEMARRLLKWGANVLSCLPGVCTIMHSQPWGEWSRRAVVR
jgi:hypothetical protein